MKRATCGFDIETTNHTISIHALVKRATVKPPVTKTISSDFNPRPREEGDSFKFLASDGVGYFNPRPREEGDRFIVYIVPNLCISIHALVKRATVKPPVTKTISSDFNPRPREEGDKRGILYDKCTKNFNPRPREEGDTSVMIYVVDLI